MSTQLATIAVLGATGGVANGLVVNALRAGAHLIVLVRTPSKLTAQLEAQGISKSILASQLTIVTGSAIDVQALKSTLTCNNTPNYIVPHIVTALGAAPSYRPKFCNPIAFDIDQPTLCGDASKALIQALKQLYQANPALTQRKPKLTFVSTTGISNGPEDVPYGLQTFYHSGLRIPHVDKRVMETEFRDNVHNPDERQRVFSSYVGVRPTLLMGGVDAYDGVGSHKLKVGTEAAPAKGYTIHRSDVGQWIWINDVSDPEMRKAWEGEMVTLTA